MANQTPMWWMRGDQNMPQHPVSPPPPPLPAPPPELPPMPECECCQPDPQKPPRSAQNQSRPLTQAVSGLADRLRHADGETLMLLALLWLLYHEKADHKLLLALAYILF